MTAKRKIRPRAAGAAIGALSLMLAGLAGTPPVHAQGCGGQECVFKYRGDLRRIELGGDVPDTYAKDVEIGDVDGNGWLDLYLVAKQPEGPDETIVARENIDQLYLSRGSSTHALNFELDGTSGTFEYRFQDEVFGAAFDTVRGYDAELADIDLDGNLDVVRPDMAGILKILWGSGQRGSLANPVFPELTDVLLENGGDPNAGCTFAGHPGGTYDDVALADLDHDGDLDIVAGQYNLCGSNLLIRNDQRIACQNGLDRGFTVIVPPDFGARSTHSVSVGDADRDGNLDVLLAHAPNAGSRPRIFYGDDADPFFFTAARSASFDDVDDPNLVTIADLVGPVQVSGCGLGVAEAQDDLDRDGLPDIFFGQPRDSLPTYGAYFNELDVNDPPLDPLLSPPYGAWTPGPLGLELSSCREDACLYDARYADLDLDGRTEVVVVTLNNVLPFATGMEVFEVVPGSPGIPSTLAPDTGTFFPVITTNQGGIAVDLGDLDNDGDLDVVLGGFVQSPISARHFTAAHVHENRTLTRLAGRAVSTGILDLIAIRDLTAGGPGTTLSGSVQATLRAGEEVVLQDGFTASPGTNGEVVVCAGPDCLAAP